MLSCFLLLLEPGDSLLGRGHGFSATSEKAMILSHGTLLVREVGTATTAKSPESDQTHQFDVTSGHLAKRRTCEILISYRSLYSPYHLHLSGKGGCKHMQLLGQVA